jgi:hypothetical protein
MMPGPFPGMDPYLEPPRYWRGFHNGFIFNLQATLNRLLPPGFAANYEERVIIIPPERSIYPDVLVWRDPSETSGCTSGGTAILEPTAVEATEAHGIVIVGPEEIHDGYLEIRTVTEDEQVVTIVEILSPTNKAPDSPHREEYRRKQSEVLRSQTHLLEIDLLRGGMHTVAAPVGEIQRRGGWDGIISLHRSTQPDQFEYWFTTLRQSLPKVKIPLMQGLPELELDLQAAFDQTYDAGPYRRRIDYRQEAPLPLQGEDAIWMDTLLREKGLR